MGWMVKERRGISWRDQTLESLSPPPLPLVVFFGLFMALVWVASYSEYKERVERGKMGLRLGLMMLPLAAVLVVNMMMLRRRWWRRAFGRTWHDARGAEAEEEARVPVGLVVVVLVLVGMVYHQSSFKNAWFRGF